MIAALYVLENGPYYGIPGVDPWPEARDARKYAGPWSVVAHPPCARWGRYWSGGPSNHGRFRLGDDGGCFAAALAAVRRWGGVLEHPADSHAWTHHGLAAPSRAGDWIRADYAGWTCYVEQGHYGHPSRKPTWLYVAGVESLPILKAGTSGQRLVRRGLPYRQERRKGIAHYQTKRQRAMTPIPFRDLLLSIARAALAALAAATKGTA